MTNINVFLLGTHVKGPSTETVTIKIIPEHARENIVVPKIMSHNL